MCAAAGGGPVASRFMPTSTPTPFFDRLEAVRAARHSALCVGIDPRLERLPAEVVQPDDVEATLTTFGQAVIEATRPYAACWKLQIAFYEAHGLAGLRAYSTLARTIREQGGLVIGDVKRNDIGSTAQAYAKAHLAPGGDFEVDAVTLNPYLGRDALEPFVEAAAEANKGMYVLVRTSNPGGVDLQDRAFADGGTLFERVADLVSDVGAAHVSEQTGLSLVGAVIGATRPDLVATLRERLPHTPFLLPGFGAQGAGGSDVAAGFRADGSGAVVNASRSVVHPPDAGDDWRAAIADAARRAVEEIHAASAPA